MDKHEMDQLLKWLEKNITEKSRIQPNILLMLSVIVILGIAWILH